MDRRPAVTTLLRQLGADVCLVTTPEHIYYLSGFCTPGDCLHALLVPADEAAPMRLITRDLEGSHYSTAIIETYDCTQSAAAVVGARLAGLKVAYEAGSRGVSVAEFRAMGGTDAWIDVGDAITRLRLEKSREEIACMALAARQADRALAQLLASNAVRAGVTELQVAGALGQLLAAQGSECASYPLFVASGANGCIGHHPATRRVIANGDVVFLEFAACVERYHVARMHTVCVGTPPPWFDRLQRTIKAALEIGVGLARPGARARDLDTAMRAFVAPRLGADETMLSRSGYHIGIGLVADWSEKHFVDACATHTLRDSMTLHLIPWVQKAGHGAVGFSRTVRVTSAGGVALA